MKGLSHLLRRGFAHGVHPEELKERTKGLHTQRMPFVARYVLPLKQHLGAPSKPVVEVGRRVRRGELIAESGAFVSTALHAPATGWVCAIGRRRFPDGRYEPAIEIEADPYATQRLAAERPPDWRGLSLEDLVPVIQRSGIVGLGGAALPAHVKYSLRQGQSYLPKHRPGIWHPRPDCHPLCPGRKPAFLCHFWPGGARTS